MPDEDSSAATANRDLAAASCEIVVDEPHRVEVVTDVERPGLLVLSDLHYPGWTAEVTSQSDGPPTQAPILRTNRVMRGIYLEPGKQRIVFAYRPKTVYVGAIISALGWIVLAGAAAVRHSVRLSKMCSLTTATCCRIAEESEKERFPKTREPIAKQEND